MYHALWSYANEVTLKLKPKNSKCLTYHHEGSILITPNQDVVLVGIHKRTKYTVTIKKQQIQTVQVGFDSTCEKLCIDNPSLAPLILRYHEQDQQSHTLYIWIDLSDEGMSTKNAMLCEVLTAIAV